MNEYKIIFLDIDGVLNSDQYNRWKYKHHMHNQGFGSIDPRECYRMARFCEKYNIKLVISSSWRNGTSWQKTYDEFLTEGFEGLPYRHHGMKELAPYIVGVTPYSESRHRGTEIQYFFDVMKDAIENINKYKEWHQIFKEQFIIDKYCIVDDDNDILKDQFNNFVQTDPLIGITRKDYRKIIKILEL